MAKRHINYIKEVRPMRKFLAETYPECFTHPGDKGKTKKPLKTKIHLDILEKHPDIDVLVLMVALKDYCSGPKYALSILGGYPRVGLDGKIVEETRELDQKYYATYLKKQQIDWEKRKNGYNRQTGIVSTPAG